ncbi:bifunctional glutamate N-acetyltransferase/amino-acid acetyltransferase ArgJ [Magnetospira thiophila]
MSKVSPLAPAAFPALPVIEGVRLAAHAAGIRYRNRSDLMLMHFPDGAEAAGVFTTSKTASEPVHWCRNALQVSGGRAHALLVNAGNANAFTGMAGKRSVERTLARCAAVVGCPETEIYLASTGTIGQDLPDQRITDAMEAIYGALAPDNWEAAARAFMTTDTFPKGATRTTKIGHVPVRINGIAKGSGMIAPDMATMLSYVVTDADLPSDVLQQLLRAAVDETFNCITVDSDTSTSDSLMLFATGKAGNPVPGTASDPLLEGFRTALHDLLLDLALLVVKDGEGASKLIEVQVSGAENDRAAKKIAFSIANSPLVKTAIAGEDANWGRIVMAVGKSGEAAERDKLVISIGGIPVAAEGRAVPDYDEAPVAAHMKGKEILIQADVGIADGSATVWTCDLTYEYIRINADYRT